MHTPLKPTTWTTESEGGGHRPSTNTGRRRITNTLLAPTSRSKRPFVDSPRCPVHAGLVRHRLATISIGSEVALGKKRRVCRLFGTTQRTGRGRGAQVLPHQVSPNSRLARCLYLHSSRWRDPRVPRGLEVFRLQILHRRTEGGFGPSSTRNPMLVRHSLRS